MPQAMDTDVIDASDLPGWHPEPRRGGGAHGASECVVAIERLRGGGVESAATFGHAAGHGEVEMMAKDSPPPPPNPQLNQVVV